MNLINKSIAVVGLGYVGLPLAVEFGKSRPVIGFDINQNRISELEDFEDHTKEVSSEELKLAKYLKFSNDLSALKDIQVFILTMPTPIDSVNRPDLTALLKASEMIGKVLKQGDVVIYES